MKVKSIRIWTTI